MLQYVSNQEIPSYVTTRSYRRAWQMVITMLILAIYFTVEAVQHLMRVSSGAWFYVPAAVIGIAALAHCSRNAAWLHRHPQSRHN